MCTHRAYVASATCHELETSKLKLLQERPFASCERVIHTDKGSCTSNRRLLMLDVYLI